MIVVTSKEFFENMEKYCALMAENKQVIIKYKADYYKLVPVVFEELFEEEKR